MISFSYENQGTNTYLVYQIGEEDSIDSMSLGMITNNQIVGMAPTVYTQMDTNKYIKYNVSAKISVRQFFTGPVNRRRLLGVFNGIVAAMLSAEDYMIDDRMILLDTDYIFADVSTCETVLICLPIQNDGAVTDLGAFFKNIMFNTQFDQTENCDYVARIINHLNSTPVFSLAQFKAVLDDLNGQSSQSAAARTVSTVSEATLVQQKKSQPVVSPSSVEVKSQLPVQPVRPVQQPVQPVVSQPPVAPVQKITIPAKQTMPVSPDSKQPETQQPASDEKEISLFYLLQHYNSENAAAYKAQKAAKKAGGAAPAHAAAPAGKSKGGAKKKNQGQSAATSFAIPGQAAPVAQNPTQQQNQQPVQPARPIQQPVQPICQQPVTPIPAASQPVVQMPIIPRPVQPMPGANFGETTVLGGGVAGETTVLNAGATAARQINPHLIRAKNNENIPVNKPVFRIGKEKSYVDYFVADNTAISRSHANIITREDKYFVLDTNSTNHTFVNGQMISSSTEVEITHGTKLRFANEDFEFQLY